MFSLKIEDLILTIFIKYKSTSKLFCSDQLKVNGYTSEVAFCSKLLNLLKEVLPYETRIHPISILIPQKEEYRECFRILHAFQQCFSHNVLKDW